MGLNKCRIINLICTSVYINDIHVFLPGRNCFVDILEETASKSSDLTDARKKKFVTIQLLTEPKQMPIWPFISTIQPESIPTPVNTNRIESILQSIDNKLGELLNRPVPPPPEVLAAHINNIQSISAIPYGLSGGGPLDKHPQYIPSTILPVDVEIDIKTIQHNIDKPDIDSGIAALKKLKKK
jgi:hypothetical protein